MMPDWVSGPMIGPEALAVGIPGVSPNGGKEIYVDSTAVRSAYERGGLDPASYAIDVTSQAPSDAQRRIEANAPEALPQELIDAMRNGQPPPAHVMPTLTQPPRVLPSPFSPPPAQAPLSGAVEMMIPVGGGVTARVMFVGGVPSSRQWLKLIRHLQIEAEEEPSDESRKKAENLGNAVDSGSSVRRRVDLRAGDDQIKAIVPRPAQRRKRKDVSSTAEPGQP
jgi:hypothetical protein